MDIFITHQIHKHRKTQGNFILNLSCCFVLFLKIAYMVGLLYNIVSGILLGFHYCCNKLLQS